MSKKKAIFFNSVSGGFVYSTVKLIPSATISVQLNYDGEQKQDIGFVGTALDTATITTLANGGSATFSRFYDQMGNNADLTGYNGGGEPLATDGSFNGQDFLGIASVNPALGFSSNPNIDLTQDWIIQLVARNLHNISSSRLGYSIHDGTNFSGLNGCFFSGGQYFFDCRFNGDNLRFVMVISDFITTFKLITLTRINGVNKFYLNDVEDSSVAGFAGVMAIGVNIGNSSGSPAGIGDFKTLSYLSGDDLSSFNVSNYNQTYITAHGI